MLRQGSPDRRTGGEGYQTGRAGGTSSSRWSLFGTKTNLLFLFEEQMQDDHQMQCIVLKNGNGNTSTKNVDNVLEMEKENVGTLRMCRSRQAGFCSHQTSEALRWRRYKVDVHRYTIFCPPLFSLRRNWGQISLIKGLNVAFLH